MKLSKRLSCCALVVAICGMGPRGWTAPAKVAEERLAAAAQQDLARRAIDACAAKGAFVAAAVAGPDRVVRTLLSHDKASPIAVETARRKAMSAALVGYPTSGLTKAAAEAPAYVDMLRSLEPALVTIGGGLPIRIDNVLLGGFGIGGAAGPQADEACAQEALSGLTAAGAR